MSITEGNIEMDPKEIGYVCECSGFNRHKTETRDGIFWIRQWNFGFYKNSVNSSPAETLPASQEGCPPCNL